MSTDKNVDADERRLELLHEWLDCDDKAGKKLWFTSGFFEECKQIAWKSAKKRKNALKNARLELDEHYIKGILFGWLWEEIVHPWKKSKSPKDFASIDKCRRLVSTTVAKRVVNLFKHEQGLAPKQKKDPVESGDAEDEKELEQQRFQWKNLQTVSPPETLPPEPDESPAQSEPPPLTILHAFHDWLVAGPTSRAKILDAAVEFLSEERVSTTPNLEKIDAAEKVVDTYLDEKAKNTPPAGLYDHLRARELSPPGTYTSRLRDSWRQFRDEEEPDRWTAYTKDRINVTTEFSPYVSDSSERPLWGRVDFGMQDFDHLVEKVLEQVDALQAEGGGVLVMPHDQWQEPSISLLLSLLSYTMHTREDIGAVRLLQADLEPHRLEEALNADVLIVSHLPRLPGLLSHLESSTLKGKVVVGTGMKEEWQRTKLPFSHRALASFPEVDDLTAWMHKLAEEEIRKYTEMSRPAQRLYEMVAVWDARAVPIRFDLLARALEMDEAAARAVVDELAGEGLLYWINPWTPQNLRVASKSPVVARKIVEELAKLDHEGQDIRLDCFHTVFKALDPKRAGERSLMLQLFQSAVPNSRAWQHAAPARLPHEGHRWANALIRNENWPQVEPIFSEVNPVEAVLWGRTLAQLRLFDKADAVLEAALDRHPENAHLLHAHAQTQADQVQVDATAASEAEDAFEKASREAPGNCYVYQSWAAMRARAGRDPTLLFRRALRAAGTPSEHAAVHVAWAHYEAERDQYKVAEHHLDAAEEEAPGNAYVPHMRGKVAFLKGEYSNAEKHFHAVIERDVHSVVARNALGHMARVRGARHYDMAEEHLGKAYEIDPENVPTLHERGNLLADMADAEESEEGGNMQAPEKGARREALEWYKKALKLEPCNVRVLVSSANALLPLAAASAGDKRDTLRGRLEKALELSSDNAQALHVFGRFHQEVARQSEDRPAYAREQRKEAQERFERIRDSDRQNLPALCSLAKLHADAGDEEKARSMIDASARVLKQHENFSLPAHKRVRSLNACAEVLARLGSTEDAIEMVEEAKNVDSGNSYTKRLLQRLKGGGA